MATTTTSAVLHSIKIILMSIGVLFIAILLAPQISNLTAAQIPSIWSSLGSWLRPPYLYVIINGIIITIAASSRLHHHHQKHHVSASPTAEAQGSRYMHHHDHYRSSAVALGAYTFASLPDPVPDPVPEVSPLTAVRAREPTPEIEQFGESYGAVVENHGPVEVMYDETEMSDEVEEDKEEVKAIVLKEDAPEEETDDDFGPIDGGSKESPAIAGTRMLATASPPPPPAPLVRQETSEIVSSFFQSQIEKPPPSARFGNHRRPTPEGGKALRVAKPRRNETLESTWKTITEGRHMPLTRHLKKSDTWDHHNRQAASSDPATPSPVKKSETFTNRTINSSNSATTRLKKEASLGQDELNRRVEAFINKFNEEMRLQRQESIQQYNDMINRAA